MNRRWLGVLSILGVAFAWGTVIPILTYLSQRWDAYFLSAFRYLMAVPLLYIALLLLEGWERPSARPAIWRVFATGWLGLAGFAFLFTFGIVHSNPFVAAILAAANPIVAAFIARVVFSQSVDRAMTPSIVLASLGCAIATIDWASGALEFSLEGGEIFILLAAACWSWYSLAVHRWLKGWSQLRIAAHTVAAAGPMLIAVYSGLAAAGIADFPPSKPEGWDVIVFTWLIGAAVVAGLLLWNYGVSRIGLIASSVIVNLSPVFAIAILTIGGSKPATSQVIGGTMVIAAVLLSQIRSSSIARPTDT